MPTFPSSINAAAIPVGVGVGGANITPSDTADLPYAPARSIYVGSSGNVALVYLGRPDDDIVMFYNLPVGFEIKGYIRRVMATNTTASLLTAQY